MNRIHSGSRSKIIILFALFLTLGIIALFYSWETLTDQWSLGKPAHHQLKILKRALHYVELNYLDQERMDPRTLLKASLEPLQLRLAPVLIRWNDDHVVVSVRDQKRSFDIPEPLPLKALPLFLGHVADFIEETLPKTEDDDSSENIEYLLIEGILSELDPHSNFLRPKSLSQFKIGTSGNFGGIGIAVGMRDGYLTVISPLEETPAYRAGIRAQDIIIQINDEKTTNMTLTDAVDLIRGEIGTEVSLQVRRTGEQKSKQFSIKRDIIRIQSVKGQLLENSKIGLVKIKKFQEDTEINFYKEISKLVEEAGKLDGIILDMRNNPGGLLRPAVAIADAFLSNGIIVKTVAYNKKLSDVEPAKHNDSLENIPTVVLVNGGSASASEIVAGALQANNRALVIGQRTFGKGSVQTVYELKDGSALKLTIAKYLAGGISEVQLSGITPDIALVPNYITEERIDLVENQSQRESDISKHLSESSGKRAKHETLERVRYLSQDDDSEPSPSDIEISYDYPVKLAQRILSSTSHLDPKIQWQNARQSVQLMDIEQEAKIIRRLAEQHVDWTIGPKEKSPEAKIKFWMTHNGKKIDKILAGQEIMLHVSAKNIGSGSLYRLSAVTNSDNALFNDLEFPLGEIQHGQQRSYSVKVAVPHAMVGQGIPVELHFLEHYQRAPQDMTQFIEIMGVEDINYTYSWEIIPINEKILPNKDITLRFTVQNHGPGISTSPVINLINKEGDKLYLTEGRKKLEPMDPGSTQTADLKIRIKKGYKKKKAHLSLFIEDDESWTSLSDELYVSLSGTDHQPRTTVVQSAPRIFSDHDRLFQSKSASQKIEGGVVDDGSIEEMYAFVNNKKVYYRSFDKPVNNGNFSFEVPLINGTNRITIIAKDDVGLLGRKSWIIWSHTKNTST